MTHSDPVLDEDGKCCADPQGVGQCDPAECVCGPDLHKRVPPPLLGTPEAPPDDSGHVPFEEVKARNAEAVRVVRDMRGLCEEDPCPNPEEWTPEEIAAVVPVIFPGSGEGSA